MRAVLPALLLFASLAGCSRDAGDAATAPSVPMASAEQIAAVTAHPPWLRDHLPAATIAYIRLPAPWALIGAPSGRSSDAMYASASHIEALRLQREALLRDPLVSGLGAAPLKLLMAQASPIEIAVQGAAGAAGPGSNVLVAVKLAVTDDAEAAKLIGEVAGVADLSFDAEGNASLAGTGAPVFLHFAEADSRLLLLGGMFATAEALKALVAESANVQGPHRMRGLEQQIDAHGQGLVLWADLPALKPLMAMGMEPEHEWLRPLVENGKAIALGFGSAGGKGRMAIRVEFERSPWAEFAPSGPFNFDIDAVGRPHWVATGAVPSATQAMALLDWALRAGEEDGEPDKSVAELDGELRAASGLGITEWMAPFGREWVTISDDAGTYSAIRLADATALDRIVATIGTKTGKPARVHEHGGEQLHHLALPSLPGLAEQLDADPAVDDPAMGFMQLYARMGSHLYWYQQDSWLVVAGVPQPLMARIDAGADHPVTDWLQQAQGASRQHALLSASTELEGISQTIYHMHLAMLQSLADLGNTPLDLFALPTADQLALPRRSGIGAEVVLDGQQLVLEMNYEHTALEGVLAGNSTTTIAVVGILAAVAVPAYQDYTIRAQVTAALTETADIKLALAEYHQTHGELPADPADAGIDDLPRELSSGAGSISVDQGAIFVYFSDADGELAGTHIYLLPEIDDAGQIHWACGDAFYQTPHTPLVELDGELPMTDVPAKLLPASCRE